MKSGLLVSIVSPSGGGKTTVVNELINQLPKAVRFVTTTTRLPRPGEVNGVDYHFLTRSEFVHKIVTDELLEFIDYAGNYYGMDRLEMDKALKKYEYVLAPIDVRGSENLQPFSYRQTRIFLKPESLEILRTRLARRPGITETEIQRRLAYAEQEIVAGAHFDAVIVNREGHLADTLNQVKAFLFALDKKGKQR